jgi:hypothetical protein
VESSSPLSIVLSISQSLKIREGTMKEERRKERREESGGGGGGEGGRGESAAPYSEDSEIL